MKMELLSPAGDTERLQAAVLFGADAVYLAASRFGMRTACKNFEGEQLANAVAFAHAHGIKVYLACNSLMRNKDVEALPAYLDNIVQSGADAIIAGDMGTLERVKKCRPSLPVHISVQAGVANYAAARVFYELGASRVILARELSLDEISEIRAKTPAELELEAFVHGAMCLSFSGRCFLSDYMTGRSAGRGDCAQPCRWKYHLVEEKRPGEYYPVIEDDNGSYILNANDLCMLEHLPKLQQAGICSVKIEGRAKSAYYTAAVTNAYRRALDFYAQNPGEDIPKEIVEELHKVSHRPYSAGFYFGRPSGQQCLENGGYIREYEVVGVVQSWADGRLLVSQRNKLHRGQELDILTPANGSFLMRAEELFDEEGVQIESTPHPQMLYQVPCQQPVPQGSLVRISKKN